MEVFFRAELQENTGKPILTPVVLDGNENGVVIARSIRSIKAALMLASGFSLAQYIEEEGGMDALKRTIDERNAEKEKGDDGVREAEVQD